jgi:exodeoxyribonuclease VII small subunit
MPEPASFEEALELLESSVARLESGELKLEEALTVFEQGIVASRACNRWLEETRKRVQVLTADEAGELHLSFLDEEEDEPEADAEDP